MERSRTSQAERSAGLDRPLASDRFDDAAAAWEAVQRRDQSLDGAFVYGVRTTGIYCRPSCPSRRPHRKNVEFFQDPNGAERAGYRACRRCRPRERHATVAERAVERAKVYLDARAGSRVSLESLAKHVGLSPFHLQRTFKRIVGVSPKAYADGQRVARFKEQLRRGETVSRATYAAGFNSSSSAYSTAAQGLGMTPAAYRRGGLGTTLRYTIVSTSLGWLLVAATERGVCAVTLGDTPDALVQGLRAEFPRASLERDDAMVRPWADEIGQYVEGRAGTIEVPLVLEGSTFQLRVWQALRDIPPGETRSYREVAETIGQPTAARAVARACATNRVALAVPCHRVVREGGALGGYRWGIARKERLLERERRVAQGVAS